MLQANIPNQCSMLLIGSPGIGLLEFNVSLAKDSLERGEVVVFVAVDGRARDVIETMDSFGVKTSDLLGKRLFMLDYHSTLLGSSEEKPLQGSGVRNISDLEAIMFNIAAIAKETQARVRIFLYTLSTLFLYNQPNVVLKFFQISGSRIRAEFGSIVVSLHDGVHDEKTVNHLMAISDGVIELRFDEDLNKMMRIRHMRGIPTSPQWIPFDIVTSDEKGETKLLEWK
ncbi:MAG TPA: RAD55 family ATPase [Methanomassiliicoccales archaeon]|nr:RAD55 family ATPase [Methanomassiliicoccales archaeon]